MVLKEIDGFPGYFITSVGEVFSIRPKNGKPFPGRTINSWRKLNPQKDPRENKGYLQATLLKNGIHVKRQVHRLVAEAFIPNESCKAEVNHKNGVKSDNRVENLEWCTKSENEKHAYKTGLKLPVYGNTKINLEQANVIRGMYVPRVVTLRAIAEKFGISEASVSNILSNKTWAEANHG